MRLSGKEVKEWFWRNEVPYHPALDQITSLNIKTTVPSAEIVVQGEEESTKRISSNEETIEKMFTDGKSITAIAGEINVSETDLVEWLKKNGREKQSDNKDKEPEKNKAVVKRGRGRPRKNPVKEAEDNSQSTEYTGMSVNEIPDEEYYGLDKEFVISAIHKHRGKRGPISRELKISGAKLAAVLAQKEAKEAMRQYPG